MADVVSADSHELLRFIMSMESSARHLDRLLPVVADILVSAVDDVYEAEGPGWAPFSPNTRRKRGSMGAAKLLQDTGLMAGSTVGKTGSHWAEAMTTIPYTKYHVSGNRRLPKRNPFDLGEFEDDVLDDVAALFLDEVADG